jgi:predicted nucleic acid-binding protein
MARRCLIDAGPLVAFFIRRDQHHSWAVSHFKTQPAPFFTCEAVLAEAEHILERFEPAASENLRSLLETGVVEISFSLHAQLAAVLNLQRRYTDVPMALADACLVRMAELDEGASIFTTDSDFRIYRKSNRKVIPLVFPHER